MATVPEKIGTNGNGIKSTLVADEFAWDYDYGVPQVRHLDDDEMLEKYQAENQRNPGALISVNAHECGHWTIDVYSTEMEKRVFYAKRLTQLLANALKLLSK